MYILFFLCWIIFNGQITTEIVIFGIVLAAVMMWFICKFLGYDIRTEYLVFRMSGYFLRYIAVLFIEIMKANWMVICLIFMSRNELQPALVKFKAPVKSKAARILLANSITLTPGTITVSLEEDEYMVHCLDKELGVGIDKSVFVTLLLKMEETAERIKGKHQPKTEKKEEA